MMYVQRDYKLSTSSPSKNSWIRSEYQHQFSPKKPFPFQYNRSPRRSYDIRNPPFAANAFESPVRMHDDDDDNDDGALLEHNSRYVDNTENVEKTYVEKFTPLPLSDHHRIHDNVQQYPERKVVGRNYSHLGRDISNVPLNGESEYDASYRWRGEKHITDKGNPRKISSEYHDSYRPYPIKPPPQIVSTNTWVEPAEIPKVELSGGCSSEYKRSFSAWDDYKFDIDTGSWKLTGECNNTPSPDKVLSWRDILHEVREEARLNKNHMWHSHFGQRIEDEVHHDRPLYGAVGRQEDVLFKENQSYVPNVEIENIEGREESHSSSEDSSNSFNSAYFKSESPQKVSNVRAENNNSFSYRDNVHEISKNDDFKMSFRPSTRTAQLAETTLKHAQRRSTENRQSHSYDD